MSRDFSSSHPSTSPAPSPLTGFLALLLGRVAGAWGKVRNAAGDGELLVVHKDYAVTQLAGPSPTRPAHLFEDTGSMKAFIEKEVGAERVLPRDVDILVGEKELVARLGSYKSDAAQIVAPLKLAPAAEAWLGLLGRAHEVDTVYQLAREHSAVFPPVKVKLNNVETQRPGAELMLTTLANVEISAQGNFKSSRNATGMITVQGGTNTVSSNVELPERWELRFPIFEAQLDRFATVELLLHTRISNDSGTGGKKLMLGFTCPQLAVVMREARMALVEKLQGELGEAYTVGLGTVKVATPPALLPVEAA